MGTKIHDNMIKGMTRKGGWKEPSGRPLCAPLFALVFSLVVAVAGVVGDAFAQTGNLVEGLRRYESGDFAGALQQWQPLADMGSPDALFNIAQLYRLGQGVPVDMTTAESYYTRAARAGHVTAKANLATIYYFNLGTRARRGEAIRLWRDAASHGDGSSQYMLAVLYFNGDGVPGDKVLAYAWLLHSIENGFSDARMADSAMRPALTENEITQAHRLMPALLADNPAPVGSQLVPALPAPEATGTETDTAKEPTAAPGETAVAPAEPPAADSPDAGDAGDSGDSGDSGAAPDEIIEQPPEKEQTVAAPAAVEEPVATEVPTAAVQQGFRSLDGRWSVQLGFFGDEENAMIHRRKVEQATGQVVDGLWWDLLRTERDEGRRVFHRLLVGPLQGRDAADTVCAGLKAEGFDCFVVAP